MHICLKGQIAIIALGGNAILQRGEKGTFEEQYKNITKTSEKITDLIERGYKIVITHGNGPQVGATLLRHEAGKTVVPSLPLFVCGGETQGFIGYMIQQALRNELQKRGRRENVATIITRVLVDKHDPAFKNPTKPIGPFYDKEEAEKLLKEQRDLVIKEDAGRGYRRVVASPDPKEIAELTTIKTLVDAGIIVVACGGGGIPIIVENGEMKGVDAVIDKDLAGERLATTVGASKLIILTDVEGAYINYGTPQKKLLRGVTLKEIQKHYDEGQFKSGSMEPKVLAAIRFVQNGGEESIISDLNMLTEAVDGKVGTHIHS